MESFKSETNSRSNASETIMLSKRHGTLNRVLYKRPIDNKICRRCSVKPDMHIPVTEVNVVKEEVREV